MHCFRRYWDSWGSLVPVLRWCLFNGSVVFRRQCLKWWICLVPSPPSVVRMCYTEEASALFVMMKRPEVLPILEFFWWYAVSGWLLARNTCFSAEAGCSQHPGSLRRRTFSHVSWRSIRMTGVHDYFETVHGISFRSYCLWEWPGVKMNVNWESVWGVPLARHVFISGS